MVVETVLNVMPQDGWQPLSASQSAHLFMYALQPELRGYFNIFLATRVEPALDPQVLAGALQRLAARHPMLRTHFGEVQGRVMQRALDEVRVSLAVVTVDGLEPAVLAGRVESDRVQPFDEFAGPLWRVSLYRRDATACVLLFTADHLICDGWSLYQLIVELGREISPGMPVSIPSPARDYFDYVAQQPQWLKTAQARRQFEHWAEALADHYPAFQWPFDRDGSEARDTMDVTLGAEPTAALRELAAKHNTSPFVALLAGYFILLHRMTGQTRLSVGAPAPARSSEFTETIGCFNNTVVLRVELDAGMSVAQLLEQLRSTVWRALKHQAYPLAEIIERLNPPRIAGKRPYFETMFVFQRVRIAPEMAALFARTADAKDIPWGEFRLSAFDRWRSVGSVGMPLRLDAYEIGEDRLWVALDYDAGRFERSTIESYLQLLQRVLSAMAGDAEIISGRTRD